LPVDWQSTRLSGQDFGAKGVSGVDAAGTRALAGRMATIS